MPIVTIKLAKGRSEEQKSSLVSKLTPIICEELKVDKNHVTILFEEYDRQNWATAGELHSNKYGSRFSK